MQAIMLFYEPLPMQTLTTRFGWQTGQHDVSRAHSHVRYLLPLVLLCADVSRSPTSLSGVDSQADDPYSRRSRYVFFASWPLIFGPPGIYKLDTIHSKPLPRLIKTKYVVFTDLLGDEWLCSAGLTFLPMGLGGISAAALLPLCERYYLRRSQAAGEAVPEARLLPTFFVGPLVAFGLL